MGYIYQADVYCDGCGGAICDRLKLAGEAPENPSDEYSFDSDEYPKVADVENEESDTPQHCGQCHVFLENPLTSDGYKYVGEKLDRTGAGLFEVESEWASFYGFEWFEREDGSGYWNSREAY